MSEWKKVKIDFATIRLGDYIEPIKTTVADTGDKNPTVYGVTNKDGISQTGKPASKDISNYIVLEKDCFAFNPYRINVGSIGINDENLKGCVSPAYVVFKTKNGLLPKFLYFYLKSDYGIHLINWYGNRGGVRNALRYSDLCKIDIPDIRHLNQEKLLKTFSSASTRIDELNKEIEKQKNYAKKLRQNILQEAIEGKLTEDWRKQHSVQKGDPDYDAEALFEQIQNEKYHTDLFAPNGAHAKKAKSVSSEPIRVTKKEKSLPPITEDEIPFGIPTGWKWVRLGEIIQEPPRNGYSPKAVDFETPIKTLKLGAVTYGVFDPSEFKYINEKIPEDAYCWLKNGDFLIERSNSFEYVGICAIYTGNDNEFMYPDLLMRFRTAEILLKEYIHSALVSPFNREYFMANAKGAQKTMPKINQECVVNTLIPLPPLAEQKEIVARVEQHLQTITQLETQIATRETTTKQLMQSILKDAFEEG